MPPISRRTLLKLVGVAAAVVAVPIAIWERGHAAVRRLLGRDPIDRTIVPVDTGVFSGDNPDRSHQILWDIPGYMKRQGISTFEGRTADEQVPLVIVGGGMSGLGTAWLTREQSPVVLERADRFGGNARGEAWEGIDYAIGAAYFLQADPDEPLFHLYQAWDVDSLVRVKSDEDPVLIDQKIYREFWSGESDPEHKTQFEQLKRYFLDVFNGTNGHVYPDIPTDAPDMLARVNALDGSSFQEHLEKVMHGPLHPHIVAALDHYCWSSLGGTWAEVSAAAALNFFAAEFGKVCIAPGGNAAVAERVLDMLTRELPEGHLRTGAIVFHVDARPDGVFVAYEDADGKVRTLLSKAAVLCCPKFVVKHILQDIEPARLAAINQLRYRSYLLANVLLTQEVSESFYDLFLTHADPSRATDVVLATYAKPVKGKTVLTLYRGLPIDGARANILLPDAYAKVKAEFEQQIREEILPALKVDAAAIAGVRFTRWGHPLPLASKGLYAAGLPAVLRAPFRERVFFVQQDNWALPAIETALSEALHFTTAIRAAIKPM